MSEKRFNRDANVVQDMPEKLDEAISAAIMAVDPVSEDPVPNEEEYAGGDKLGHRGKGNAVDEFLWDHTASPEQYEAIVKHLRRLSKLYSALGEWEPIEEGDA